MNAEGHLTSEEQASYWRRTLAPQTLLELSEHLQECAWCREQLLLARPAKQTKAGVSYEEFVAWMEENLDPLARRDLAERMAASPQASAELADLVKFREEMDQLPPHHYSLAEGAAPSRSSWILPIAAGLALGFAFLWWTTAQQKQAGLALNDAGQRIVVRQDGAVPALGSLPPDLQKAVHEAASLGRAPVAPALAALRGADGTLAGTPGAVRGFAIVAPVGTLVETSRPSLRWSPEKNATGYRVNLASKSGGEVVSSPLLNAKVTEWSPNESLKPGESYQWEVEALRADEMIAKVPAPPEPEARFVVLPDERRKDLAELRARFGRSHLLMGLAYAKNGLLPQARAEFEQLAQENPQNDLPKRLLAGLTRRE